MNCLTALLFASTVLLQGEPCTKPPIAPDPFPDRLSAFVWRNWPCVSAERMAKVVGATEADLSRLASEMGLPPQGAILPEWRRKGYITILRRNWQLLPYEQLVDLVDMTREELSFRLKEDDFLFGKLGGLKPKCERLVYDRAEAARLKGERLRIASILKEEGIDDFSEEPRFTFVKEISRAVEPSAFKPQPSTASPFDFRMISSYFADYGDPLGDPEVGSFPEGLLQKLAAEGVNAVWMHVVLNTLVKDPKYPEFGKGSEARVANLKKLVARAGKYGIRVFLYMNEPRAMPKAFFEVPGRENLRGVYRRGYDVHAMCTSAPEVRRWLHDSLKTLFSDVKGLGGIFTITMSENLTNCASNYHREGCPRCRNRSVAEIVAEVNATMVEGMTAGDPNAEALIYNWAWADEDEAEIVARLPKHNCRALAVSENGIVVRRGGAEIPEDDYSISVVGPGEIAKRFWKRAKKAGLPAVAKVQADCSWELSSFPYIPVMDLVAEHARNLAVEGVGGVMLSWSCGSAPAMNLSVYRDFRAGETSIDPVLNRIAAANYGEAAVPAIRRAWTAFSEGFREFPFDVVVAYKGPQHWGPANPLYLRPTGYEATMVGIPYDGLEYGTWDNKWIGRFPVQGWIEQMDKVADGFDRGVRLFADALPQVAEPHRAQAAREQAMFRAQALHFRSCGDQARFILARDRWDVGEMLKYCRREREAAKALLPLVRGDSRIGYECSNHYFYIPNDVREKILGCRRIESALTVAK